MKSKIKFKNKNIIYYPSSSKEWYNSIYSYNKSYIKPLVALHEMLNIIFKNYFNMIENKIKLSFKRRRPNKSRYSANKIYISKAELKHTNTKLVIILYAYNKQKLSIEQYIRKLLKLTKTNKFLARRKINVSMHRNKLLSILKKRFFLFL